MFTEVDEALRTLLRTEAVAGTDVEVALDAPTRDWASRRNKPTIDLYLYDIREEVKRRSVGAALERDERGLVTRRVEPPRYFRLAYLVTAWTQRPDDEHRLLASVLACLIRHDALPLSEAIAPHLFEQGLSVGLHLAYPASEDRRVSDVWTSLGGDLKPSLDLLVIMPVDTQRFTEAAQAVMEPLRVRTVGFMGPDTSVDDARQRRQPVPARNGEPPG
ncbi:MAG TPA: DUF4255 domain-containing protein [Acidimicrobiales bacterium]|nr:DUF4255 domain-containing protein [Acidimicrobiales bacterium]